MFYIYILYSPHYDKYYVGFTENYLRRIEEHNTTDRTTFTTKYRPWEIAAVFECGDDRGLAMKIEKFIKKQKSRKFTEKMINGGGLHGILAQLVPPFGRASLPRISNSLSWRQGGLEKLQKSKIFYFSGLESRERSDSWIIRGSPEASGSKKRSFKKAAILGGFFIFRNVLHLHPPFPCFR